MHCLAIQGLWEASSHFYDVIHILPLMVTIWDILQNSEKYEILLHVVCGSGAILVIFSDFGRGHLKSTFWHILTILTKINYDMEIYELNYTRGI